MSTWVDGQMDGWWWKYIERGGGRDRERERDFNVQKRIRFCYFINDVFGTCDDEKFNLHIFHPFFMLSVSWLHTRLMLRYDIFSCTCAILHTHTWCYVMISFSWTITSRGRASWGGNSKSKLQFPSGSESHLFIVWHVENNVNLHCSLVQCEMSFCVCLRTHRNWRRRGPSAYLAICQKSWNCLGRNT